MSGEPNHDPTLEEADVGSRLGPFVLRRRLGMGGMGTVFLAEVVEAQAWAAAEARVAVKVLHDSRAVSPKALERFRRESRIGSALQHPSVVRTFDAGVHESPEGNRHWIALEYIEGKTLRALMQELSTVPESLLRLIATQIAEGLDAIHRAGAVHRDVKPGNVVIDHTHRVKLLDLGIARLLDESVTALTGDGLIGTPIYASPEQLRGATVGPASDLYSLGVLLYEAACGQNPFAGGGYHVAYRRHLELVPPKLGLVNPALTPFFEELVHTLLEKDPARRLGDAGEVARICEEGELSAWWRERENRLRREQPEHQLRTVRLARRTAMVGREGELGKLTDRLGAAWAGRGGLVLIEGEAGVGKSRLVAELLHTIESSGRDAWILRGSCDRTGGPLSDGFLDAVQHCFGPTLSDRLDRDLVLTRRLARSFLALLQQPGADPDEPQLSDDQLHALLSELATGLARERPVLWVVDDLHRGDPRSERTLLRLSRIAEEHPLLLIATLRPPLTKALAQAALERTSTLRLPLDRLSPRALIELLTNEVGARVATQLGASIATKSDGNPFFALAIVRELRDRNVLTQHDDGRFSVAAEVTSFEVPSSVGDLVGERLRDLGREDRSLLDAASVQGFAFDPDLIARVLERSRLDVLQRLADLERSAALVRATGSSFTFDHHLLHESLYGALPPLLRAEYHARLAAAFAHKIGCADRDPDAIAVDDALFLAEHRLKGGERDASTLQLAVRAAGLLLKRHRGERVLELTDLALSALGPDPKPSPLAHDVLMKWINARHARTPLDEERNHLERAMAMARALGDGRRIVAVLDQLAQTTSSSGRIAELAEIAAEILAYCETHEEPGYEARARQSMGLTQWVHADFSGAIESMRRAAEVHAAAGDLYQEATAHGTAGLVLIEAGRFVEARVAFEESLRLATATGNLHSESIAYGYLGELRRLAGDLAAARELIARRVPLNQITGLRYDELSHAKQLAELELEEARYDDAAVAIDRLRLIAESTGGPEHRFIAKRLEGELAFARGELDAAIALFLQAREILKTAFAVPRWTAFITMCEIHAHVARQSPVAHVRELIVEVLGSEPYATDRTLAEAYQALLGDRDAATVRVGEDYPVAVRALIHVILAQAGAVGQLAPARRLLETLAGHLDGEGRARFFGDHPTARRLVALEALHGAGPSGDTTTAA